jgi:cytochrome c
MDIRVVLLGICVALGGCARDPQYRPQVPRGDPQRGRMLLEQYDCGVCHVIPGVRGARGYVGPPLAAYRRNVYVAGKYPNVPEALVRWIVDAPSLSPESAMPALGVSEAQAQDMAAYLYTLK